jgi:hypothetical protein
MAYVEPEIFRKLDMAEKNNPCTEKLMTMKNSHKVYLEEHNGDKHDLNKTGQKK